MMLTMVTVQTKNYNTYNSNFGLVLDISYSTPPVDLHNIMRQTTHHVLIKELVAISRAKI